MEYIIGCLVGFNRAIGNILWGWVGLIPLLGTGVLFTVLSRAFQLRNFGLILRKTICTALSGRGKSAQEGSISQFQAMCTALAACVGVGNIAGVAAAIALGGPGAVFWMWVASFFGMMTAYAENLLGICYRRKNSRGTWSGGPMYYLRDGLGALRGCKTIGRILAALFALFCIFASFGIGNMSQVNTIAVNLTDAFPSPALSEVRIGGTDLYCVLIGGVLMILEGVMILGGTRRIARLTEKIVPFMVVLYVLGAVWVILVHAENILPAITSIFRHAFGFGSAAGGVAGYTAKMALEWGFKRGVFSNEAGLGSTVMVNSVSDAREGAVQGMWAVFEVFVDTIVMCTLTALVLLTSGLVDLADGSLRTDSRATSLVAEAFSGVFGSAGAAFIAICVLLFAFSTVLGWSCYGAGAWEYLFGERGTLLYKLLYVAAIFLGATTSLDLVWELSDTFNALMMLPNLVGVVALTRTVLYETRRYLRREKRSGVIRI